MKYIYQLRGEIMDDYGNDVEGILGYFDNLPKAKEEAVTYAKEKLEVTSNATKFKVRWNKEDDEDDDSDLFLTLTVFDMTESGVDEEDRDSYVIEFYRTPANKITAEV